jgi:hypothetical protein
VPLRSVEAATRDDAIAAAREQFGPSARVVGVRRVRSGGVLGFFATERYVAEVAPDHAGRPAVPVPPPARADDAPSADIAPSDFSSPLASAAPARARAGAPARNGAAAWAAEAVRPSDASAAMSPSAAFPARTAASMWPAAPVHLEAPTAEPAKADDERVSELAALLAAQQAEPAAPAYSRASFPRASEAPRTRDVRPSSLDDGDAAPLSARGFDQRILPVTGDAAGAAPSPFTAALARMVAGDRDVRQAVKEALERPAEAPWPAASGSIGTAGSAVPPVARQEEETVDQVFAPSTTMAEPMELPTWAAEPEVSPPSGSPREEAIAEVLRAALAQGHSDEALTGILRKVLDGASPQTALTDPTVGVPEMVLGDIVLAEPPVQSPVETPVLDLPVVQAPAAEAPVMEAPVMEAPVMEAPVVQAPVTQAPVVENALPAAPAVQLPPVEPSAHETPAVVGVAPVFAQSPAPVAPVRSRPRFESMWGGTPAPTSLWGEPAPAASAWSPLAGSPIWGAPSSAPVVVTSDAPIWADVSAGESSAAEDAGTGATSIAAPIAAPDAASDAAAEVELPASSVAEVPVAERIEEQVEILAAESTLEETVEEELAEVEELQMAPLLARTASDPAPMMSLDSTTVMPPLSLLPPLPSSRSRGRGRPPVPRSSSRPAQPSATPPATPDAAPAPAEAVRAEAADVLEEVGSREKSWNLDAGWGTDPSGSLPLTDASTTSEYSPEVEPSAGSQIPGEVDGAPASQPAVPPATRLLATVTRLPVTPLMAGAHLAELPEEGFDRDGLFAPASTPAAVPGPGAPSEPRRLSNPARRAVARQLVQLGVPDDLLGSSFEQDIAELGVYAALTRSLALGLPKAPEAPTGPGETLFVVGPGVDALRAARSLAASLRLDPDRVQWATRGDLAGLAHPASRVTNVETAIDRRQDALAAGTVTIVAVDAPLRTDAYWMAQMMAIWTPVAVWGVVEATRKPEDLEPWIDGLPQLDALIVQDTDLSADPAAVLRRVATPVAVIDGARATPHRWASLLCERIESTQE